MCKLLLNTGVKSVGGAGWISLVHVRPTGAKKANKKAAQISTATNSVPIVGTCTQNG